MLDELRRRTDRPSQSPDGSDRRTQCGEAVSVTVIPHNCVFNFSDFAGPAHCVSLSNVTSGVIVE